MTIESYDGLCGIIATFASSDNRIRCKHEFGHSGPCSFEKYRNQFQIQAGAIVGDWDPYQHVGYIPSPNGYKRVVIG